MKTGDQREPVYFNADQDYARHVLAISQGARRQLRILSRHLEPAVFAQPQLVATISALARQRDTQVRVLIRDTRALLDEPCDLLALARRLSSSIAFRSLAPDQGVDLGYLVLADNRGVVHWPRPAGNRAYVSADFGPRTADLADQFDRLWGQARRDRRLREWIL